MHLIPFLLFRSWIAFPQGQASTPVVLSRPSLRLLSCRPRPAPYFPLNPCSPAPRATSVSSFPVCSPSFHPLFPTSTSPMPLSTPVGAPFLVLSILRHFREPLPSPAGLNLRPGPCRSWGGSCLNSLSSCPPPQLSLLSRSFSALSLDVFRWFVFLGALLHADERPGRLHSLLIARPSPCTHATFLCQRLSGLPAPPPPPHMSYLSHPCQLLLVGCGGRMQQQVVPSMQRLHSHNNRGPDHEKWGELLSNSPLILHL